jgi:hypothetical protein
MTTVLGGFFFYLAILNSFLASEVGTCTQGSADELMAGALVSSFLYLLGIGLLAARPPERLGWIFLVPGMAGVAYQTLQAFHLFLSFHALGTSLCEWKLGPHYPLDGREALVSAWWLLMSLSCVAGLAYVRFRQQRRFVRETLV